MNPALRSEEGEQPWLRHATPPANLPHITPLALNRSEHPQASIATFRFALTRIRLLHGIRGKTHEK